MIDSNSLAIEKSPHWLAVTLVCTTFPLIWVGGLVTTYAAGMAVPDWPTTYGYNMFLYPLSTWWSGPWDLFIEHGHRLLGSLAGLLTIGLNVAIWRYDRRSWVRWLGGVALVLVVAQGVLGGLRVRLDSATFARLHGCTGPLFFSLCVALSVVTSRFWRVQPAETSLLSEVGVRGVVSGWFLFLAAYAQLVLGSHLRHPNILWSPATFRMFVVFHVVAAVFLVLQCFVTAWQARRWDRALRRPVMFAAFLLLGQFFLGIATWRAKYGWPTFLPILAEASVDHPAEIALHNTLVGTTIQAEGIWQGVTVTGHVAVGSLILACSVWYAMRISRYVSLRNCPAQLPPRSSSSSAPALASVAVGVVVS